MSATRQYLSDQYTELMHFFKGTDFSKAILLGVAVSLPIFIGIQFDAFEIGLALCFGAFWSSPSDVGGNFKQNIFGILTSILLVVIVTFIGGYLRINTWILVPVLGGLSFLIAYISVYGFRASMISFTGLLALILSFAQISISLEVYEYALLVGLGGLWYFLLSTLFYFIRPKAQVDELFTKTFLLTAEFIATRGKLLVPSDDRKDLQAQSFNLQSTLTTLHIDLRNILISTRKASGKSFYKGKRLLVFAQMVDILETAIAHPVNYDKMDDFLKEHPSYIKHFQDLIFAMSAQLETIARAGKSTKNLPKNKELTICFQNVFGHIKAFGDQANNSAKEQYLMLQNYLEYQEEQFKRIRRIKWLFGNAEVDENDLIKVDVFKRFVTPPDYDPKIFIRNLSLRSNIFRHSLRLSATLMIGFALGTVFDFQNPYWILLTILVIMRPSYGLTKTRSKDRVIGTIIGSIIAVGIIYLTQDVYLYGVFAIITLVTAFAMVQKNYKTSAVFITLSVIFIYGIIQPDITAVIQFRILDTILGALLSFLALRWLWPAWSFSEINLCIQKSVEANMNYFTEISTFYKQKGGLPASFKLARKEAFVETSNLSAAFQRMAQEPRSKQKNMDKIYQMVELNHVFLSSLASLSSYFQQHTTTEASLTFVKIADQIDQNLQAILAALVGQTKSSFKPQHKSEISKEEYDAFMKPSIRSNERDAQEAHLISEQLRWLSSLSENMRKLAFSMESEEQE